MEDLLSKLAAQMDVIRAAPLPFALAVIAAFAITALFFGALYSTTIISKDSQIALWKDRAAGAASTQSPAPTIPSPSAPLARKRPVYIERLNVGYSKDAIIFVGAFTLTTDRLRIFADVAPGRVGRIPPTAEQSWRLPIAEIKDPVKGQSAEIKLVQSANIDGTGPKYWWGDPSKRQRFPDTSDPLDESVYCRIVVIGPNNEEQLYYLQIVQLKGMDRPFLLLPQFEWNWEGK